MADKSQLGGVYKITCLVNGKCYIGSSYYIKGRLGNHKYFLRLGTHENSYLQNAWNKYKEINFKFEAVEVIYDFTKEKLIERETYWIELCGSNLREFGYNLRIDTDSNLGLPSANKGRKHKEESLLKMSKSQTGKKKPDEAKINQSLRQEGKAPLWATAVATEINRNKSKWPHELGAVCQCRECKDKMNAYHRNRRKLKRFEMGLMMWHQ